MYLIYKLLNFYSRTKCQIKFYSICTDKFSVRPLLKMPNFKSKKIFRGMSHNPNVEIEVVGSGAIGVPSNVLLITGGCRYLVNCGEGSQKLANEYRLGFEKLLHVFITSPSWRNISGLLGLCISSQKQNAVELTLHGHDCIDKLFLGVNKFANLRYSKPKLKICQHYEEFTDGNISVKYVYLYSSTSGRSITPDERESSGIVHTSNKSSSDAVVQTSDCYENLEDAKKIKKELKSRRKSLEGCSKSPKPSDEFVISYIFQTQTTPGSLHIEKCIKLGLKPGPLLGILKSGKDVTLSDGTVIKSENVKEPDSPGISIIVVECPTIQYLDSLLQEPTYFKYQSEENAAGAVIHFSSSDVVKNPKYQEWINRFSKETKHLFLNEGSILSGSVGIYRQQFKLNYVLPSLFPPLQDAKIPDFPRQENSSPENGHTLVPCLKNDSHNPVYSDTLYYKCESNSFINAETLCKLYLKPKKDYDYSKCLVLKKEEFLNEMFASDDKEKIEECKKRIKDLELTLEGDNKIYPKIVFLGTGSGKPSKVRNASGILIFLEENKCMLFDCGENTYNQLVIFYGREKVAEILRKLVAIYVSHLHIDHHMGLITLLIERKRAFDEQYELNAKTKKEINQPKFEPIYLMAPMKIQTWLNLFSETFEDISQLFDLLPNSCLDVESKEQQEKKENCQKRLNLRSLMTTPVPHCNGSFGVSVVHTDGWKITYSGDTRPCDALVNLGKESDILIHEATFESAAVYEAQVKKHSTIDEAIEIGRKMNAKFILLTHFSQRYCYLPVIEDKLQYSNIGIAFDFLEVPYNKLLLLPALLEPLQYIFSEHDTRVQTYRKVLNPKRTRDEAEISEKSEYEDFEKSAKILKQILDI